MIVVIAVLVGALLHGQTRGMGRVSGKVTRESGKPIEGVVVRGTLAAGGKPVDDEDQLQG